MLGRRRDVILQADVCLQALDELKDDGRDTMTRSGTMKLLLKRVVVLTVAVLLVGLAAHARADFTFEVNSLADTGRDSGAASNVCDTGSTVSCPTGQCTECTLRAAIETVNSLGFGQSATIVFADYIPTNLGNPVASMFFPVNGYNAFARQVHIDGTTHPAWDQADGIPRVIIRGENAVAAAQGLNFGSGGAGSVVDAVTIYDFPQAGIRINADEVTVRQSQIGTTSLGSSARPNDVGILVLGDNNLIGHPPVLVGLQPWPNIISGNSGHGVVIEGDHNTVAGNRIGVNRGGTTALANGGHGIHVLGLHARIGNWSESGFLTLVARNQIAGNSQAQVHVAENAGGASLSCNHIGTHHSGSFKISGHPVGVLAHGSANQIGAQNCRNVISGAIHMGGSGIASNSNTVTWNCVGTNADGDDLGVEEALVAVAEGNGNLITNNTIGNGLIGISLSSETSSTGVRGNFVGTDSENRIHPLLGGIISDGFNNFFGGTQPGDGNVVGNIDGNGIWITSSAALNVIQRNRVGVSEDGTPLPVLGGIASSGTGTIIGGEDAGNTIGFAEEFGISIGSTDGQVRNNRIGSTAEIAGGFGPDSIGILVNGNDHFIGDQNWIGSQHTGIRVNGGTHEIVDNFIGFDEDLTPRPNSGFGIRLSVSENSRVIGNQVGFSTRGIRLNSGATGTVVGNNWLGVTPDLDDIGNSLYGYDSSGAFNFFGTDPDTAESMRNVVGFNGSGGGVRIAGQDNLVINNYIGVWLAGQAIPNGGSGGLILRGNPAGTQIGLSTAGNANYIGHNLGAGIEVRESVSDVQIGANRIGRRVNVPAPNHGPGIHLRADASNILMTGSPVGPSIDRLWLAYNAGPAIVFDPDAGTGNRIQYIHGWNNSDKLIDLGPGGRDQDPGDADTGPNNLQNFPEIHPSSFFDDDNEELILTFRVDSDPANSAYPMTIEVILKSTPGFQRWFGSTLYQADDAMQWVTVTIPQPDDLLSFPNPIFAATATDAMGNTSELSDPINLAPVFTVGGTVSNLTGTGLVLQNNGSDDLSIDENGPFVFEASLEDGADYEVTVSQQPSGQICTVSNGSGQIDGADVDDVEVNCQAAGDEIFRDRFEPAPEPSFSFSEQLAPTFRHPRCETCHAVEATGFGNVNDDPPGVLPATHPAVDASTDCTACHTSGLLPETGSIDPGWQSAPAAFDFRNLDDATLCNMASPPVSGHTPLEHMTEDKLVLWAVGDGRVPFDNPDLPTAPPHDIEVWRDLVIEWVNAGMPCD